MWGRGWRYTVGVLLCLEMLRVRMGFDRERLLHALRMYINHSNFPKSILHLINLPTNSYNCIK
jgi:hypothetical protein